MLTDRERLGAALAATDIGSKDETTEMDTEWLQDKMEKIAGTRDLEKGNRRMEMVHDWRYGNEQ